VDTGLALILDRRLLLARENPTAGLRVARWQAWEIDQSYDIPDAFLATLRGRRLAMCPMGI
jgi:hypothetical protein